MKKAGFRFLTHTTDLEFEAEGKTFSEALENSARAMFSGMTDISKVLPKKKVKFKIARRGDEKALLYDFLDRLIFMCDSKSMFFSKFKVSLSKKDGSLACEAFGELIHEKHEKHSLVKAVTYHEMRAEKLPEGKWICRAIVDI